VTTTASPGTYHYPLAGLVAAAISLWPRAQAGGALRPLGGLRLVPADAGSGSLSHPEWAFDGDPNTEFSFGWGNGGASLLAQV